MMARSLPDPSPRTEWLADAGLRAGLERFVRRRLSGDEALDVVQSSLADALASDSAPADEEGFRRFVFVIARNKIADHFRRHGRETPDETAGELAIGGQDPVSARDLLRWAEDELPSSEDRSTLEWMLREADGDKLEHIAEEARVPAPRVRQRVSRLRRYLRSRWAAQLAAAGITGLCLVLGYAYWKGQQEIERPVAESPVEQARKLRRAAFERCADEAFEECLDGFDRAKALDPSGDSAPDVQEARRAAAAALRPAPQAPAPAPSAAPAPLQSAAPQPLPSSSFAPKLPPAPKPKPTAEGKAAPPPLPNQKTMRQAPAPKKGAPQKASKGASDDFDFDAK